VHDPLGAAVLGVKVLSEPFTALFQVPALIVTSTPIVYVLAKRLAVVLFAMVLTLV